MIKDKQLLEAYEAVQKHKTFSAASRALGIPRQTLTDHYRRYVEKFKPSTESQHPVDFPTIPDDDLPVEDLIEIARKRFQKRRESKNARNLQSIRILDKTPIVIAFVGDPHLDDNGCDWDKLLADVEVMRQPGVYAVNVGDTTNNWTGRLMRLYAKQDASVSTARKYAEWLMTKAGIRWLAWVLGNHDGWENGDEILRRMNTTNLVMDNWSCRFNLVFGNDFSVPIWVSHHFKGSSQWNKMHGSMKAAIMRGGAAIYASGHLHEWAYHVEEIPDTGAVYHAFRARGYKTMDDHAEVGGFPENKHGHSIGVVIDPREPDLFKAITVFPDLNRALRYRNALL